MGGSSKKQTVGYRYFLGIHMILCHGPIDKLTRIRVDGKDAWIGGSSGGSMQINAENLFGGEPREGGVSGIVDVELGHSTQAQNSYLTSKLGSLVPSFRGVVGIVLRQCYLGVNPYLKKWSFLAQRVNIRQKGEPQWYLNKAAIPNEESPVVEIPERLYLDFGSAGWKYKVENIGAGPSEYSQAAFDDSSWAVGQAPFGDRPHPSWDFHPTPNTIIPVNKEVWLRRVFYPTGYDGDIQVKVFADNYPSLWWNGTPISLNSTPVEGQFVSAVIPAEMVKSTGNVIAYRVQDVSTPRAGNSIQADLKLYVGAYSSVQQVDMNPAHIIRECLTDPDWGMGYQETDIDDVSFAAAADTLFNEGMGMSLLWDRQIAIEEFIKEIVKHIDAALYVDRQSGRFTLKLIRNDYNIDSLIVLDPNNIDKISDFSRPAFGELTNSITVNYWNASTGTDSSLTVQDIALSQMQNATINTTVQYPGFTKKMLASRVAQRDLKTLSTPLISCTIYANRDASVLGIGSCFKLTWPDYDVENVVMRVTGIAYGDGKLNRIRMNCTQDVFSLPEEAFIPPTPPVWEDPNTDPVPAIYRIVTEAPYLELVQRLGQTTTDQQLGANEDLGYLIASAAAPAGAINARLAIDNGSGYDGNDYPMDFCPIAFLESNISATDTVLAINGAIAISSVVLGSHAQIGEELVKVVATSTDSITIGRGVLDTIPSPHAAGSSVMFWDAFGDSDNVEYVRNESIDVKILPTTGRGTLPVADAPQDSVVFNARASRPYPPGNIKINGQLFPNTIEGSDGVALTWAHRDRTQQTGADLVIFTDGNIGPEVGTTYSLKIYNENDTILRSVSNINGTSYSYSTADELTDGSGGVGDPSWSNVVLLCHMNGANNSTSIVDSSLSNKTISVFGDAKLTTSDFKFSPSSLILDGAGDYVSLASNSDFDLGDTYTVEFWIKPTSIATNFGIINRGFYRTTVGIWDGFAFSARWIGNSFGRFYFYATTSSNQQYVDVNNCFQANTWTHCAIVRQGTVGKVYINGVLSGTKTGLNTPGSSTEPLKIGIWDHSAGIEYFNGLLDEIRITKGVARYTSDFTPSNAPFPDLSSAGKLNGKLRLELESVRSSLASWQKFNHTVERTGYGFNYGKRYGS